MCPTRRYSDRIGQARRYIALAFSIVSPGYYRAISPQRQGVASARGYCNRIGQDGGDVTFTFVVEPPLDDVYGISCLRKTDERQAENQGKEQDAKL